MGVSCDLSATPAPEQSACPGTRLALSEKDQLKKGHDHECFSVPILDRLASISAGLVSGTQDFVQVSVSLKDCKKCCNCPEG